MSNLDVITSAYAAFAQGDIPNVLAAFQPDITWTSVDAGPVTGRHKGTDEVVGFFGSLPVHYPPFTVTPDKLVEDGDQVIVLGRHVFESGDPIRFTHVWDMVEGKAAGFTEYVDSAELVARQK
jgi:uncharacterized protein